MQVVKRMAAFAARGPMSSRPALGAYLSCSLHDCFFHVDVPCFCMAGESSMLLHFSVIRFSVSILQQKIGDMSKF
jgi:hypothetical protein